MKEYGGYGSSSCCYYHPKELLLGVCPLCLNDRLLILAAKQGLTTSVKKKLTISISNSNSNSVCKASTKSCSSRNKSSSYSGSRCRKKASPISLPKLFALGSLFYPRYTSRHLRSRPPDSDHVDDNDTTSTSPEDESFISIKFGDNGVASWDKTGSTVSKVSLQHCSNKSMNAKPSVKNSSSNNSSSRKSVVEHAKPRAASLRWRKRIGQLLQVIRWNKSSSKAASVGGGNGKVETVKIRSDRSWIKTLKIRTKA